MDNVCHRCLFSIPSKVEMAEEQIKDIGLNGIVTHQLCRQTGDLQAYCMLVEYCTGIRRRGHEFECRSSLNFFRLYFHNNKRKLERLITQNRDIFFQYFNV